MKSHLARWLPIAFSLTFFIQGYFGSLQKSLTWDEPVFIASGYSYLTRNDFRLNSEAPPLLQILHALPLLPMRLLSPSENHPIWQQAEHVPFGKYFMQANAQHLLTITYRARLSMLLIGSLLVFAIFFWGNRLYGPIPALGASALAAFSPNLLAHAKLATTDLGCTAFIFFAVFTFWHAVNHNTPRAWFFCGIITGLALLTKYTALLLGPIYILLGLVCLWRKTIPFFDLFKGTPIVILSIVAVIGIGYNFSFNLFLYFEGLQRIYANAVPEYQFYLLGNVSDTPWWYYYLIAFALKTPVPTLVLIALAATALIRQKENCEAPLFLLIPALFILLIACFDQSNLGYRRILPALPFLLLFCAHALSGTLSSRRSIVAILLLIWTGINAAIIYPHHLSFFNTLSGGPSRGPYLLDDSNIDWGQDLPGLATWERKHPDARPLRLWYFGTMLPIMYGVTAQHLQGSPEHILKPQKGYYAVSVHNLAWFRKLQKRLGADADWLTKYEPVDRVGYSIYIYQFPSQN